MELLFPAKGIVKELVYVICTDLGNSGNEARCSLEHHCL